MGHKTQHKSLNYRVFGGKVYNTLKFCLYNRKSFFQDSIYLNIAFLKYNLRIFAS